MKYDRLTHRNGENIEEYCDIGHCKYADFYTCNFKGLQHNVSDECVPAMIERLAELEDKIEQGLLVELPISDRYILEDYAHIMFDSWNDTTGAIHKGRSWYGEVLSVIDDIVGMVYGITARQYEAKLKELQE